ncbi:MAG: DUF433 domain-containing protein [Anaerolineales bacterium]|nr:DUF433 domain-containing protein [Anaerolineales bacterium]
MARYSLNLPTQLKQVAEEWAARQGVSLNQFILWAVSEKVGALDQQLDTPEFPQITYRRGAAGYPTPVIRGTGIRVQSLVIAHNHWQLSVAEIAEEYGLRQAQVEEALAFYAAHRPEVDAMIAIEDSLTPDVYA